jgi:hypothetical protein
MHLRDAQGGMEPVGLLLDAAFAARFLQGGA